MNNAVALQRMKEQQALRAAREKATVPYLLGGLAALSVFWMGKTVSQLRASLHARPDSWSE